MAMKKSTPNSSTESNQDELTAALREAASPYALDLPVDNTGQGHPPRGNWEDGFRLSAAALEMVRNRPEVFAERDRRMCFDEFVL
jgi:hypothetical protein